MTTRRQCLAATAGTLLASCAMGTRSMLDATSRQDSVAGARPTDTGKSPLLKLNNGIEMPVLGFATYRAIEEATSAVVSALRSGYRLVDTAAYYKNEQQVGEAIARSGVPRSALFVASKLWMADFGYDQALKLRHQTAKELL